MVGTLASASEHRHLSACTPDLCVAPAESSRVSSIRLHHHHLACPEPQHVSSYAELNDPARNFECNSCMRLPCDPVVTLCGHLFCWPCLYQHLSLHNSSCQRCPVCKADVQNRIVPVYGCGRIDTMEDSLPEKVNGGHIPSRPPATRPPVPATGAINTSDHRSEPQEAMASRDLLTVLRSGLYASFQRFGIADLPAQRAAVALRRRRRFNNEKVFVLHWVSIFMALFAIGFFLSA